MTWRVLYCLGLALCGAAFLAGVLRIAEGETVRGVFACVAAVLLFATNVACLRHEDER
jgi:drug/metabolite transporter (DMT)-like permease